MLSSVNSALAGGKDDPLLGKVMIDQLEVRDADEKNPVVLAAQGWLGKDLHKLWIKTDVERVDSRTQEAELQALYSQAIAPFWDVQVGVRQDFQPTPNRTWAVIGFQGLAPYFFEIDTALFVGESGRTALRLDAEYELLFTQRLILTPEIEVNFYGQNDAELGVGSGLSDIEAGLRLRYEIRREFAPYIGVNWNKSFGNTADFARNAGEEIDDLQWVIGVRAWF
jgi:copper resistance protein B